VSSSGAFSRTQNSIGLKDYTWLSHQTNQQKNKTKQQQQQKTTTSGLGLTGML